MNNVKTNEVITKELLNQAMTYDSYEQLLQELFEQGKTTGDNQSEAMLKYAKMNLHRMKRLNKTTLLIDELKNYLKTTSFSNEIIWLVITEGWCGDAAQNLPIINKIASAHSQIDLKLILRDENLVVMDEFLTNGGRSIPKLIALNSNTLEVLGTWGPRPQIAQQMVIDFKKLPNGDYNEFTKSVQLWYAKDKTISLQKEMLNNLKEWSAMKQ